MLAGPPIRILPILSDEDSLEKKFSIQRICWKKISHAEYLFKKESPWWHFIGMDILNADFNREYLLKRYFSHWELIADEILTMRIHCKKYSHRDNSLILVFSVRVFISFKIPKRRIYWKINSQKWIMVEIIVGHKEQIFLQNGFFCEPWNGHLD